MTIAVSIARTGSGRRAFAVAISIALRCALVGQASASGVGRVPHVSVGEGPRKVAATAILTAKRLISIVTASVAVLINCRVNGDKLGGGEFEVSESGVSVSWNALTRACTMLEPVNVVSTPVADSEGHPLDVTSHALKVRAIAG